LGVAAGLKAIVGSLLPGGTPAKAGGAGVDPLDLLNHKVPITDVMRKHQLGLDHFLRAGITLEDFLKNGYMWHQDLLQFEDLSGRKGQRRAMQALTIGMRANATHFRDYPEAFPYADVMKHVGLSQADVCRTFGLVFPEDGPLECYGDQRWTAKDCVALGLCMDDLVDAAGLRYKQQYEDLMHGLSRREASAAEKALETRIEHVQALVDLEEPQVLPQVLPQVPAVRLPQQQQVFYEEETPPPPRRVPLPAVAAAAVVQERIVHTPPPFRTRYEKFQRHGAKIN
jgi:hypothetical protein